MCPMQGSTGMKRDLIKYPKYRDQFLRTFDKMLKRREEKGLKNSPKWKDAPSVLMWWVGDNPLQQRLFDPEYLR